MKFKANKKPDAQHTKRMWAIGLSQFNAEIRSLCVFYIDINEVTGAIFSKRSLPLISSISTKKTNSLIFTL